MRADAQKNRTHLLAVAREVVAERGVNASMRDIARRAEVGLATLLRHFPTREALFEALLCTHLDALVQTAGGLEKSDAPGEALVSWFREWMAFAQSFRGVVAMMAAAHTNPESALYAACAAVHSASARLLLRAQAGGQARTDMNGDDLFATFAITNTQSLIIWWFSRLYLYGFIILFIYLVLSLFIAIIMDSYETIKDYYQNGFPLNDLQKFTSECEDSLASYLEDQRQSTTLWQSLVNLWTNLRSFGSSLFRRRHT